MREFGNVILKVKSQKLKRKLLREKLRKNPELNFIGKPIPDLETVIVAKLIPGYYRDTEEESEILDDFIGIMEEEGTGYFINLVMLSLSEYADNLRDKDETSTKADDIDDGIGRLLKIANNYFEFSNEMDVKHN